MVSAAAPSMSPKKFVLRYSRLFRSEFRQPGTAPAMSAVCSKQLSAMYSLGWVGLVYLSSLYSMPLMRYSGRMGSVRLEVLSNQLSFAEMS